MLVHSTLCPARMPVRSGDGFLRIIAAAEGCLLSSVSLLESSMVLAGRTGDATSWADLDALIARAGMRVVPQDLNQVATARAAFLRYGKGRSPAGLNLRDCAAYALARFSACRCSSRATTSPKPT